MGVPPGLRAELESLGIICTGFVPLSSVIDQAKLIVHHGGIGTTYAGLLAGVPAVVVPQAFDQAFNGQLVEAADVGILCRPDTDVGELLAKMSHDSDLNHRCAQMANLLTDPEVAAGRIAARLLAQAT
jgi:UDP:flavonoid glycosyltransferase YjiC (YdhE family)